jgi:transcriptional regulator with XRE-family HTH domain
MIDPSTEKVSTLLVLAADALGLTQEEMGRMFNVSSRTISRWQLQGTTLGPDHVDLLARRVYPVNAPLAARIAALLGATLESLGIMRPPKLVEPLPPPPPPPRLVEVVLCAAADALDASPRVVRPAVIAAFEAARDVGLDVGAVIQGLKRPSTSTTRSAGKTRRSPRPRSPG